MIMSQRRGTGFYSTKSPNVLVSIFANVNNNAKVLYDNIRNSGLSQLHKFIKV